MNFIRGIIDKVKAIDKKYDIFFYIGVVAKAALLGFALYSAITKSSRYYGLVAVYAMILVVKIPSFIIDKHLTKKIEDKATLFQKKHIMGIYAYIVFMLFSIAFLIVSPPKSFSEISDKPFMLLILIVLPWAVLRTTIEIVRIARLKKHHDPYRRLNIIVNLISVSISLIVALIDIKLAITYDGPVDFFVLVIVILLVPYYITANIYILVVSIRGLVGARKKHQELFVQEETKE